MKGEQSSRTFSFFFFPCLQSLVGCFIKATCLIAESVAEMADQTNTGSSLTLWSVRGLTSKAWLDISSLLVWMKA